MERWVANSDRTLRSEGWKVGWVWKTDVLTGLEQVARKIAETAHARWKPTS
jgi:very-short-patch-repair endonuclease